MVVLNGNLICCVLVSKPWYILSVQYGTGAICVYIDTDDTKLESCSYMLKGVHLLLGEPLDFGFGFAMDIFYKVNQYTKLFKLELIMQISCNTFTIHDAELRSIGAAIYFMYANQCYHPTTTDNVYTSNISYVCSMLIYDWLCKNPPCSHANFDPYLEL